MEDNKKEENEVTAAATSETKETSEQASSSSSSSWWGSWYDTAKQKINETNEFMMRDMKEFTQAVKEDASKFVASTAAQMKDQLNINLNLEEASEATKTVRDSLNDFLGKVVQQVSPHAGDDDSDEDCLLGTRSGVKVVSPAQARLYHLQTNFETYCTLPDNLTDYEEFKNEFNVEAKKEEISGLLLNFNEIRSIYTKLVPDAVTYEDFWLRYFYKKRQLDQAEEQRARLVERAANRETHEQLSWDDDDDDDEDETPATAEEIKTEEKATEKPAQEEKPVETELNQAEKEDVKQEEATERKEGEITKEEIKKDEVNDETTPEVAAVETKTEEPASVVVQQSAEEESSVAVGDKVEEEEEPNSEDEIEGEISKETSTSSCEIIESQHLKTAASSASTAAKDCSSVNSSDWEKEFDMTEEEIDQALTQQQDDEHQMPDDDDEGWDDWK